MQFNKSLTSFRVSHVLRHWHISSDEGSLLWELGGVGSLYSEDLVRIVCTIHFCFPSVLTICPSLYFSAVSCGVFIWACCSNSRLCVNFGRPVIILMASLLNSSMVSLCVQVSPKQRCLYMMRYTLMSIRNIFSSAPRSFWVNLQMIACFAFHYCLMLFTHLWPEPFWHWCWFRSCHRASLPFGAAVQIYEDFSAEDLVPTSCRNFTVLQIRLGAFFIVQLLCPSLSAEWCRRHTWWCTIWTLKCKRL